MLIHKVRNERSVVLGMVLAASLVLGCHEKVSEPSKYAADSLWLCKPGLTHDYCFDDLSSTEIKADGSQALEKFTPSTQTDFDCFYIYPTVDLFGRIGNHTDFSDVTPMLFPLVNQAARFSQLCTVYAPLYRQITLFTFDSPDREKYQEIAYGDVAEAFHYYMKRHNQGRPFVLLGHSQGSIMLRMLIQRELDGNPDLRSRLIAALLIGGDVYVPAGKMVGETFTNIPICTTEDELGCVIAYRSYGEGLSPTGNFMGSYPDGADLACTNPANMSAAQDTATYFEASYFPTTSTFAFTKVLMEGLATPYFHYRQFYTGRCATDTTGHSYLEISYTPITGDTRTERINFEQVSGLTGMGLHILDYNFPMGDLIRIVRVKALAMQQKIAVVP